MAGKFVLLVAFRDNALAKLYPLLTNTMTGARTVGVPVSRAAKQHRRPPEDRQAQAQTAPSTRWHTKIRRPAQAGMGSIWQ